MYLFIYNDYYPHRVKTFNKLFSDCSIKITGYPVINNRGIQPPINSMQEDICTDKPNHQLTNISGGNPSYRIQFINPNSLNCPPIQKHKVISLQNINKVS